MKSLAALLSGVIFGLGLNLSQMVDPARVLGFLDVLGAWDPTLAFVMIGATSVTFIGYRLVWRRETPVLAAGFQLPVRRDVDWRLAAGAGLFGMGWGLVGLCPGPAITLGLVGGPPVLLFLIAMIGGVVSYELFDRIRSKPPMTS